MIDLAAIQLAMRTWVATLAGVPLAQCAYENEAQNLNGPITADLSWIRMPALGRGEERWIIDDAAVAPDLNATPAQVTWRTCTLQVSLESLSQSPDRSAALAALALQTLAPTRAARAILEAVGVAFASIDAPTQRDYKGNDQRWLSRYILSVEFNECDVHVVTSPTTSTIESVEVTSHVRDVDGDELAPPEQWDEHSIP